jgi:hypothetical protein
MSLTIVQIKDKFKKMQYTGKLPTKKQDLLDLYEKLYGPIENIEPKITIKDLKQKISEIGYTGKIPIKKQELLDLYEKLKNTNSNVPNENIEPKMTIKDLKQKISEIGYTGKIPVKKQELLDLYEKLKNTNSNNGFKYKIVENTNFGKILNKLANTKETLPKTINLEQGINQIEKLLSKLNIIIMNLNTNTNVCSFKCVKNVENIEQFIFLLVKNNTNNFDFVKINEKIILSKNDIPPNIYKKLLNDCETVNVVEKSNNSCDEILDKLNIQYQLEIIPGDGNCFYSFIAKALEFEDAQQVRQLFADHFTEDDWKLIQGIYNTKMMSKEIFSRQDYIDKILLKDGVWVRDSDVELLFSKAFPDTSLILFDYEKTKCNLICPLIIPNKKYYIFGRYQKELHYDLYKINEKFKLTWDEIPTDLQIYIKNTCQQNFENVKLTETEFETISHLNLPELKLLFQQKNYIGKLPTHKKELLDLFKKLFVESVEHDTPQNINYDSLSLSEIIAELKKQNITNNLPRKKNLLLDLLNAPRCSPLDNEWCENDKICDIMNNVCINDSQMKGNVIKDTVSKHNISGTKTMIKKLKDTIKDSDVHDTDLNIGVSPNEMYSVSNKTELLKYLDNLQKNTIDSSFNNFLKFVL